MRTVTQRDFDLYSNYDLEIHDLGDEINGRYGCFLYELSDEQLEALTSGKILVFNSNDEYSVAVKRRKNDNKNH